MTTLTDEAMTAEYPRYSHAWVRRTGQPAFEGIIHRYKGDGRFLIGLPTGYEDVFDYAELAPVMFPATEPWDKPLRPLNGRNLAGPAFNPVGRVDPRIGKTVGWAEDGQDDMRGQVWDQADSSLCPILAAKDRKSLRVGKCYWVAVAQGRRFAGEFRVAYEDKRDGSLHVGGQAYGPDGRPVRVERKAS